MCDIFSYEVTQEEFPLYSLPTLIETSVVFQAPPLAISSPKVIVLVGLVPTAVRAHSPHTRCARPAPDCLYRPRVHPSPLGTNAREPLYLYETFNHPLTQTLHFGALQPPRHDIYFRLCLAQEEICPGHPGFQISTPAVRSAQRVPQLRVAPSPLLDSLFTIPAVSLNPRYDTCSFSCETDLVPEVL